MSVSDDKDNSVARALHDLGLAGWFGSTLMGATAVNRGVADLDDANEAGRVTNGIWRRWWPVNLVCIVAHLAGSLGVLKGHRQRLALQPEARTAATAKTVLTAAALGTATYSGWLGKKISDAGDPPAEDGTTPTAETPPEIADAMKKQAVLQWALPALTGVLIALAAKQGEQQRPANLASGIVDRLNPLS